jgi:cyanate permease
MGMKSVFVNLIKVQNVQVVVASGLLTFAVFHGLVNWLPKILESKGLSPTIAGYASSIPLLAGVPSLLIVPRIVPISRRGGAIAISALLITLSVWAFFHLTGVLMFAGLMIFGFSALVIVPLFTLILMETPEVGTKYMGSAGGLFFCISEIGGFLSPMVVGMLVDWTGGFLAGGSLLTTLGLAIVILSFLIRS